MTIRVTKPEFNLREKLSELDKPTGLKGLELMRSENTQDVRDIVHADRKNIIINGSMEVSQRATTKTGITANGFYTCDRWHLQLNGPTVSLAQDSDNPGHGFNKSLALTVTTAVGSIAAGNSLKLRYLIEGYDVARLQYGTKYAKPFTLSFWVKSSLTGQFAISFTRDSRIINRQVTVHAANIWEHKSITILGDYDTALGNTTDGTGMILQMFPSSGANSTDGANIPVWNSFHNAHTAYGANMGHLTTTNSTFKITGVQMEIGTQHTDFEFRRFKEELELCQRYFAIYPGRSGGIPFWQGYMGASYGYCSIPIPNFNMRAVPTPTDATTGTSSSTGNLYDAGGVNIKGNFAGNGTVTLSCGGYAPSGLGLIMNFGNHQSGDKDGVVASWNGASPGIFLDAEL